MTGFSSYLLKSAKSQHLALKGFPFLQVLSYGRVKRPEKTTIPKKELHEKNVAEKAERRKEILQMRAARRDYSQAEYIGMSADHRELFGETYHQPKNDQGCIYWATKDLIEALHYRDTNEVIDIDFDYFRNGAIAGLIGEDMFESRFALRFAKLHGLKYRIGNVLQKKLLKIKDYQAIHGRVDILRAAVCDPLLGAVKIHDELYQYKGGILMLEDFENPKDMKRGGHQVVITGFDATIPGKHFIQIRNVWGKWGENGYARLHLPSKKWKKEVMPTHGISDIEKEAYKIYT